MTKKETLILAGTLVGFWVVGAILFLPWTQSQLRKAAGAALETADAERYANIDVSFSGQIASLDGNVEAPQDIKDAEEIVENLKVPVLFGMAKPKAVTAVRNRLELGSGEPGTEKPPPEVGSSPFITASRYGNTIRLDGTIGSTGQKYAFADAIAARYEGTRVLDMVDVADGVRPAIKAADVAALPAPEETEWFGASKLDGKWSSFPGEASDEQIAEGLRTAFEDRDASLGGLSALRAWQENQVTSTPPVEPTPIEPPPVEPPPVVPPPVTNSADLLVSVGAEAPPPAAPSSPERVIARLTFKPNAARADDAQMAYALRLVRNVLQRLPKSTFTVSGHSDSKGDEDTNLRVSKSRAQIVVDYLIANDINGDILTAKGHGESKPIGDNDTEAGRQENRRVEIIAHMKRNNP